MGDNDRARITDFGLATIPQNPASKRPFLDDQTARWTAPEILYDSGTHSKKGDVFSFAMVMIEVRHVWALMRVALVHHSPSLTQVFTGMVPFGTCQPSMAAIAIMRGDRPPRPAHTACSNKLWELIQRCWDGMPHLRPDISEVLRVFPSYILNEIRSLYEPEVTPHEFQLALGRLYGSANYQDRVSSLRESDLKEFVDLLDNVRQPSNIFCSSPYFYSQYRCYGRRN